MNLFCERLRNSAYWDVISFVHCIMCAPQCVKLCLNFKCTVTGASRTFAVMHCSGVLPTVILKKLPEMSLTGPYDPPDVLWPMPA